MLLPIIYLTVYTYITRRRKELLYTCWTFTLPITHMLVWKRSGGLAQLRSGLSTQADLLPRKVFWESSLEVKRIIYWANHNALKTLPLDKLTFLVYAFEATLRREASEFCKIRSLWNFFFRILFVFLEKGWTVACQRTLVWLSVDSGCSHCRWLSSGLEKRPCHLLQIPLFSICVPFSGKTNTIVGFPRVCPRLVKEPLAWPLC